MWLCINWTLRGTAVLGTEYTSDVSAGTRLNVAVTALSAVGLNRRNLLRFSGLAGIATLLSGCGTTSWKQKITITVQTPAGEKSGSAVTQVDSSVGTYIGAGTMANQTLHGEATVVDLGQGKYVFGLLSEQSKTLAWQIFENEVPKDTEGAWSAIAGKKGIVKPVPSFPMLVTFGDLKVPASVKEVKPNDLAATFGSGYVLKSITLEVTDENVTEGVVGKVLPWLGPYPEPGLCPSRNESKVSKIPFCEKVYHGNFRQGHGK
jgi:hypothetical protein